MILNARHGAVLFLFALFFAATAFLWENASHAQYSREVTDPSNDASIIMAGTISGTIYVDYNMNGVRDTTGTSPNLAVDSVVSGVTVTAYDSVGADRGSSVSAANGTYSISTSGTGPYRL